MLAAFDEQLRRRPIAGPGVRVETDERLTRTVGTDGSWAAVVWSDLTAGDADEAIRVEVARSTGSLELPAICPRSARDLPAICPRSARDLPAASSSVPCSGSTAWSAAPGGARPPP